MARKMTPRDWLIVFLAPLSSTTESLDPIRIQKGMFYFSREAVIAANEKYKFDPYYYGPCSFRIYGDIDALVSEGLVERVPVQGQSWSRYRLTAEGKKRAEKLIAGAPEKTLQVCRSARSRVIRHSFPSLLKEVYRDYPEYATESIARLP